MNNTDLLHFGVKVGVAVCNYELDSLVGDLFIWSLHGDTPDKIHPHQIQTFHALESHDDHEHRQ